MLKPNDRSIQLGSVRLIGLDGSQLGVVPYAKAKELAAQAREDLVLVSDTSRPPVVRIMNFGKLCYEQKKNLKAQRKNTASQKLKEVKFHINIDPHDYETKINKALDFLSKKFRVKITMALRGREMAHQDMAFDLMAKVTEALTPYADADGKPKMLGRNISVNFAPNERSSSAPVKPVAGADDEDDDEVVEGETEAAGKE